MSTGPSYSEKELLRLVAEGDEKAFGALFHEHWDHIYTVAFTVTRSPALAEDLVQEIFLKVWLNRKKLTSIDHFDNYLFIIARNHIYTALRKEGRSTGFLREIEKIPAGVSLTPEQALVQKQSRELVREAFEQLTPQQQAVYRLSREGGLKYEEIAAQLGISKSTVRNHMVMALQQMRDYLRKHSDGLLLIVSVLSSTL